tara:strand:- start:1802 stop:2737 length:936 start_codon:yes stop_codon:yes gene_type:complete
VINFKNKILIIVFVFTFFAHSNATIKDNIFAAIGDKAITRSDVINEIKTILILNNQVYSDSIKEQLDNAAIQSLINRTVKKIELEKYPSLKFNSEDVYKEVKILADNLDMDVEAFKQTFITNEINFSLILERIETDLLWNSLIFSIYKNRISINLDEINEQLVLFNNKKQIDEYLISEIIIKAVPKDELESTISNLKKEIEINGFANVAIEKSIASTAIKGGNLGWVSENSISNDFKSKIVNTKIGEISEPFFLPKGILLFKVRDKRVVENAINLEEAKNRIVQAEKMKMLNMFSLSHFDKLRRSITIIYY